MSATDHPPPSTHAAEAAFRALLDARGILRPGAMPAPARGTVFTVFAQAEDARLDVPALKRSAQRFFGTRIGLTVEKHYDDTRVTEDAARMLVGGDDATARGARLVYGRLATPDDLDDAERAERTAGAAASGLALLARRCKVVWCVQADSDDDRTALTIAAVLASVLLGPILSPTATSLFGVRTARLLLERHPSAYR